MTIKGQKIIADITGLMNRAEDLFKKSKLTAVETENFLNMCGDLLSTLWRAEIKFAKAQLKGAE